MSTMTEAERKRMRELAKEGKLFDADGKKMGAFHPSLLPRKIEVIPPPPKSDIAQALELVAKAMGDMQQSTSTTKEVQADAIISALQQNKDVLAAVRDALAVTPVERELEQWDVVFRRDEKGIKGATMKQVK